MIRDIPLDLGPTVILFYSLENNLFTMILYFSWIMGTNNTGNVAVERILPSFFSSK